VNVRKTKTSLGDTFVSARLMGAAEAERVTAKTIKDVERRMSIKSLLDK